MHFNFQRQLSRRTVLRGVGIGLAMPWLTAMSPTFAHAATSRAPRRLLAVTMGLGLHAENLFPKSPGKDYKPSLYLERIQDIREKFTVISGVSHPGVSGGHRAEASLLSAAPMGSAAQARNTVSVDQLLAKHLGHETRFASLVLGLSGSNSPSYTENGSMIPAEDSPAKLFTKLFMSDSPTEQKQQIARAREGRSIMDLVAEDARSLQLQLGSGDRDRLDAYFTSVRELEKRLVKSEAWANRAKPKVDMQRPRDIGNSNDFIGRQRLMSDMIRLALSTDSTRFISFHLGGSGGVLPIEGVEEGYHNLSHHGQSEEKLRQLALVEGEIVNAWGDLIRGLNSVDEDQGTLLDHTSVFLTSNLGNASSHDNRNMPLLVAGGGFRHGQHLAFNRSKNYPLPNLYVSCLQKCGLEMESFATSTGTMTGLEG